MPSDGCRCNLMHYFNGEMKERDEDMKGIKDKKKVGDE
jgi:hypothetical protein